MKEMKKFRLELGEPQLVYQSPYTSDQWGPYQFPHFHHTTDGDILLKWSVANDSIFLDGHIENAVSGMISADSGKTWRLPVAEDQIAPSNPCMSNGKHFVGFCFKPAVKVDYLSDYPPVAKGVHWWINYVEDLPEEAQPSFSCMELDPKTGKTETFSTTVNWPYIPVQYSRFNDCFLPPEYCMAITGDPGLITVGNEMYYATYSGGFDSAAKTKEESLMPYSAYYNVYVFKSSDNARTWDYLSQISVSDFTMKNSRFEGFCEPFLNVMPDGSFVMLMRTGGGLKNGGSCPSYIVRSTDCGKTWSEPEIFDKVGVLPQLLTLDCGVTLASYGRPGLFLRATGDPSGTHWDAPIEIELTAGEEWRSCYYTHMVAIDETTALLAYSDFHYPLPNGQGEGKAILVRTVKILLD